MVKNLRKTVKGMRMSRVVCHIGVGEKQNGTPLIKANLYGTLSHKKNKGVWVSYCPPLDLYTQGDTKEEALENTKDAIEGFIESCIKAGTLDQVMADLNWTKSPERPRSAVPARLPVQTNIPPAFMIDKLNKGAWSGTLAIH